MRLRWSCRQPPRAQGPSSQQRWALQMRYPDLPEWGPPGSCHRRGAGLFSLCCGRGGINGTGCVERRPKNLWETSDWALDPEQSHGKGAEPWESGVLLGKWVGDALGAETLAVGLPWFDSPGLP